MGRINTEEVKKFYEDVPNVWPENDKWHLYSKMQIEKYVQKTFNNNTTTILNVGSGGNDYGLKCKMHHVDIAQNKIDCFEEYTVASVEKLPFTEESFSSVVCVGSVINYTDAMNSISQLARVLTKNGVMVLEFESSWGYEHLNTKSYKRPAEIVQLKYYNQNHIQWIYSLSYIKNILKAYNFDIKHIYRFHILSSLAYYNSKDENQAAKFAKYDVLFRYVPLLNKHSNNIIIKCQKL